MSRLKETKLQREIEKELRSAGLSYEIHVGKKHRKLFVDGHMVMVFSNGSCCQKDIGHLKKIIRGIQHADQRRPVPRTAQKQLPGHTR